MVKVFDFCISTTLLSQDACRSMRSQKKGTKNIKNRSEKNTSTGMPVSQIAGQPGQVENTQSTHGLKLAPTCE